MNKYQTLKNLITDSETLIVPDAYNGISAKLIEYAGFKAVQCSGYSFSISKKYEDESLISIDENISITEEIVNAVNIPVMADGEDGYGNTEVFKNNLIKFIKTGIAGINIEDQNLWNPYNVEKIVSLKTMTDKIKNVIEIRNKLDINDFILNARTDALRSIENRKEAIKIAITRSNQYLELGADICFITYVKTKDEIKLLKKEINGPISIAAGLPYNINEFNLNDCIECGVERVSIPSILISASMKSMYSILNNIKESGSFEEIMNSDRLFNNEILSELLK
jgi:2-methylisocitrate lyase-like PEP mutase family enzyme